MKKASGWTLVFFVAPLFFALLETTADEPRPSVRMNEIMFDPDQGGLEWIELFNAGPEASVANWTIANRTGNPMAKLPNWRLPPGGFLVVYFGPGKNDPDFADAAGHFYTGGPTGVLGNQRDDLALLAGPPNSAAMIDFFAYAFDRDWRPTVLYQAAVVAGMWPAGELFIGPSFIETGNTIGRDSLGTDTNVRQDLWGEGGIDSLSPTPGKRNLHPLGYELCALTQAWLATSQIFGAITAAHQQLIDTLQSVLKQIREKHMDLIGPLGDSLIGPDAPEQKEDGDLVVGKLRFRFVAALQHDGKEAGAFTHPPAEKGGEILIELSIKFLTSEWKMKDAVLHEIGHAAQFQHAQSGYWKEDGTAQSDNTRKQSLAVHECNCYLANLRLLCRLKATGEFPSHQHEIDERIRFKFKQMEAYLDEAFDNLKKFAGNAFAWQVFGGHLHESLLQHRDLFLQMKIFVYKLPTEAEAKKNQPGQITSAERAAIDAQVQRWNDHSLQEDQITREQVDAMINRPLDELVGGVSTPPTPPQVAGKPPGTDQPKPTNEQDAAEADRKAKEAARQAELRAKQEELEARLRRIRYARFLLEEQIKRLEGVYKLMEAETRKNPENEPQRKKMEEELKKLKKLKDEMDKQAQAAHDELEAFKRTNKEQLAWTPTSGPGDMGTLVSSPHDAFVTDLGVQLYATIECFASLGDPAALAELATNLDGYQTTMTADEASELQLNKALVAETRRSVDELTNFLTQFKQQFKNAEGDPQKFVEAINTKSTNSDESLANELQGVIQPSTFRSLIFDYFAPEIARKLGQPEQQAGTSVLKGGAVLDAPSGTPVVGCSIKLSFNDPAPNAGGDTTKIQRLKTDDQGRYEAKIPPNAENVRVTVGGEQLESSEDDEPYVGAYSLPPFQWPPTDWQRLGENEQRDVLRTLETLYLCFRDGFAAPKSDAADITTPGIRPRADGRPPQEIFNEYLTQLGKRTFVIENVAGPISQSALTSFGESLRKSEINAPRVRAGESLAESYRNAADMPAAPTSGLRITTKPEKIVTQLNGSPDASRIDALQKQLQQAVTDAAGADKQTVVALVERTELRPPAGSPAAATTLLIWDVAAKAPNGSPAKIDGQRLNTILNQFPANSPDLRFAEVALPRNAEVAPPTDPHFTARGTWGEKYHDQWALRRIGLKEGTDAGSSTWPGESGANQPCIVAVIGSGVDWTHPELLGQMWVNRDEVPYNRLDDDRNGYVDDQFGFNFRDGNGNVLDQGGHDTHVAGVVAAAWNGRGIAGINPHARIMALKVANYLGQANSIDISRAILYAADHGARVINISYCGQSLTRIEQEAIDYATAKGSLLVVAAGNEAADAAQRGPAGNRGVITVAGLTTDDKRASFSNWGQPVQIAAPAMDILGLRARNTDFLLYVGDNPEYVSGRGVVKRDLYRASGTSFAAPFVTGVASLIWSGDPQLTAQQVRNMLLMSADDLDIPGWDQNTGSGVLNAEQALKSAPDQFLMARISRVAPARRGGRVEIDVHGQADGTALVGRWIQIAFGADPEASTWQTVDHSRESVRDDGLLAAIPASRFDRRGAWSIRVLVQDEKKAVRQARATLNVE